ncbi:MAG: hypothetical protein IT580_05860 [Verrucomicrobiales bacterium]|nr:hypothetical protein [Verrucomicrobiales bacterium]
MRPRPPDYRPALAPKHRSILSDDDVVWTDPVSRGTSNSTSITVPDRGTLTIY